MNRRGCDIQRDLLKGTGVTWGKMQLVARGECVAFGGTGAKSLRAGW